MISIHDEYKDLFWLYETVQEQLTQIKIWGNDTYAYHISNYKNSNIFYLSGLPVSVLKRFQKLQFSIQNFEPNHIELDYFGDDFGFKIPDGLKLPDYGYCTIRNPRFHQTLRKHIENRKSYIEHTLYYFLQSYRKTINSWKNAFIKGQHLIPSNLIDEELQLEIIEGKYGTGKTYSILHKIINDPGNSLVVVFEKGGIKTYRKELSKLDLNYFVFGEESNAEELKTEILTNIRDVLSTDSDILSLQQQWLAALEEVKNLTNLLIKIQDVVITTNREIRALKLSIDNIKFDHLYIDDTNQFHPWSIVEIFPLSSNITVAGDQFQLRPTRDFEFLVEQLGYKPEQLHHTFPTGQELSGLKIRPMDMNRHMPTSSYLTGNIRQLAKAYTSGLSFQKLIENPSREIEDLFQHVEEIKNRSLLAIAKLWPRTGTSDIPILSLSKNHRFLGPYKILVEKLGLEPSATITSLRGEDKIQITSEISLPITFYNYSRGRVEEVVGPRRSKINTKEIEKVYEVVKSILENSSYEVGIFSGYGYQTMFLQSDLRDLKSLYDERLDIYHVDQISSYQCDIGIISLVRNNPGRDLGWLVNNNRITTMLTRARYGAIIIGCADMFFISKDDRNFQHELIVRCYNEANRLKTVVTVT